MIPYDMESELLDVRYLLPRRDALIALQTLEHPKIFVFKDTLLSLFVLT